MLCYRLQLTGGGSETYTSCVGYSVFMLMLSSDAVPAAATAASCCLSMSAVSPASTDCSGLRVYNIRLRYRLIKYCAGRGRLYVTDLTINDVVMQFLYWICARIL